MKRAKATIIKLPVNFRRKPAIVQERPATIMVMPVVRYGELPLRGGRQRRRQREGS